MLTKVRIFYFSEFVALRHQRRKRESLRWERRKGSWEPGGAPGYLRWPKNMLHSRGLVSPESLCKSAAEDSHTKEAALDV